MDTYFNYLDMVLDSGSTYADTLDVVLAPYLEQYREPPLLTRLVADSRELTAPDRTELLYQTLIRPFAELQKEKERIEKECLCLPF